MSTSVTAAKSRLVQAAIRVLASDYHDTPRAHSDDEAAYATDELAHAALALVTAIDARPAAEQPVGWPGPDPNVGGAR